MTNLTKIEETAQQVKLWQELIDRVSASSLRAVLLNVAYAAVENPEEKTALSLRHQLIAHQEKPTPKPPRETMSEELDRIHQEMHDSRNEDIGL
jgi:hypothetical protein